MSVLKIILIAIIASQLLFKHAFLPRMRKASSVLPEPTIKSMDNFLSFSVLFLIGIVVYELVTR